MRLFKAFLLSCVFLVGCAPQSQQAIQTDEQKVVVNQVKIEQPKLPKDEEILESAPANAPVSNEIKEESKATTTKIHFVDTGQSDCILIEDSGEFMLIDGGDRDDDETVVNYLKSVGVKDLKYIVGSHYDADHIGGLDAVAKAFGLNEVYVPNGSADTKVYKDFIQACMNKGLQPSVPLPDVTFNLGGATFKFLNTQGGYGDRNNDSLVVELTSNNTKALFMGDAEREAESMILNQLKDVDILKVGHHGSHSSSTPEFLDKVQPEVAIIQVGKGNKYGHPHEETMKQLQQRGIEVHRNDECGTIIYEINENGYSTNCKVKGSYEIGGETSDKTFTKPVTSSEKTQTNTTSTDKTGTYYWTPSGKSYHKSKNCSTLSRSKTIMQGTLAESGKTDPCNKCN